MKPILQLLLKGDNRHWNGQAWVLFVTSFSYLALRDGKNSWTMSMAIELLAGDVEIT